MTTSDAVGHPGSVFGSLAPPVQHLGAAVLIQGQVLGELRYALKAGIRVIERRDAVGLPWLTVLISALTRAIADEGNEAMPEVVEPEHSVLRDGIGTAEAADLLGLRPRQVRNLRARLGGRKIGRALMFDPDAVEAEAQRRKDHR